MDNKTIDDLVKLKDLFEAGIITKEQMEQAKARILGSDTSQTVMEKSAGRSQSAGNITSSASNSFFNKPVFWLGLVGIVLIVAIVLLLKFKKQDQEIILPRNLTVDVNGVELEMVRIDGGRFIMGGTRDDVKYEDNELPSHEVSVDTFYMSKFEVTQKLWKAVMGYNPSGFVGDDLPVENVSWDDCQQFVSKLSLLTNHTFRLPTEAEWEYAAKGGPAQEDYLYAGSNELDSVAWAPFNSNGSTHPVGSKDSNTCGLYDMSGNVYEWCSDNYDYYPSLPQDNPKGPTYGTNRVFRGGSWRYADKFSRVTFRAYTPASGRYPNLGLRLVMEVPASDSTNTAEQSADTRPPFELTEQHYKATHYYKASKAAYNLCSEAEFDIDWPVVSSGWDLSKLYRSIGNGKILRNPQELVALYENNMFPSRLWKRVSSAGESDENLFEIDDDDYIGALPYGIHGDLRLKQIMFNKDRGYLAYQLSDYTCGGSGVGASCGELNLIYIYDFKNDHMVTLNDVFRSDAKSSIINLLNSRALPKRERMSDEKAKRVPEQFYIENGICYFIFDKYEIGCGADGAIQLGLRLSDLNPYFTDYGRSLFY